MKIPILLISTLLSWALFDANLFRRRKDSYALNAIEISFSLGSEAHQEKKKIQQHHLDVIPQTSHYGKKPVRTKCNYFDTKSRDIRSSNQRMIRRRFNNM